MQSTAIQNKAILKYQSIEAVFFHYFIFYTPLLISTFIQRHFFQQNLYKDFFTFSYTPQITILMESITGLKKCFNYVAELSKKLLATTNITSLLSNNNKSSEKSPQIQQKSEQPAPQIIKSQTGKEVTSLGQKIERPRIICFEAFLQNRQNPLKGSSSKLNFPSQYNKNKQNGLLQKKQIKSQLAKSVNSTTKVQPYKIIENCYSNQNRPKYQIHGQIPQNKNYRNTYPPNNKIKVQSQNSDYEDQLSDDQRVQLSKKYTKIRKINQKNSSIAQSLQINTDDMMFTYDDGDDISSIAAKSQTTDQIEPQLMFFITKKGSLHNFNKCQENKFYNFPLANMKKKSSHYQGKTIPKNNIDSDFPKELKNQQISVIQKSKPKKKTYKLYPGETLEQFKKRIFIQDPSSSQQNDDEDNYFRRKHIKKEQYEKILNQLNSSMQEQRNKQASVLIVEKMIDESQNQDSQPFQPQQKQFFDQIENYKVWNNAADNSSYKLYFRDV